MAMRISAVRVEELTRESGLWCNRCALPSGWLFTLAVSCGRRMHLQERRYCDECESGAHVVKA